METAPNQEFEAILNIALDEYALIENLKVVLQADSEGKVKHLLETPTKPLDIVAWFPNGVGNNTQMLYKLNVSLSFSDSDEISEKTRLIGFRKIDLVQTPVQPTGLTFYFTVNGVKFFAKGSNWIPAHVLQEDLHPGYYSHLLESARQANMNMLRVWGGGIYEPDIFYELADKLGIMIWQDMMFACALYPTDKEFLKSVDIEIRQQIRRLQPHPSIALWAGISLKIKMT
jgi:beta-mannosidase